MTPDDLDGFGADSKVNRLYGLLRQRIARLPDDAPFPPIRQLMGEYALSQTTVTQAVGRLRDEGLIDARVGRGSVVRKRAAAKARILLAQSSWNSDKFAVTAREFAAKAADYGFAHEIVRYDYREDVTAHFAQWGADVIVIDSITDDQLSPDQLQAIFRHPCPVILYRNAVPVRSINYVCANHALAGMVLANHLHRQGHRRLGLLINEPRLHTILDTMRGFEAAARDNGATVKRLDCGLVSGDYPHSHLLRFADEIAKGLHRDLSALCATSSYAMDFLVEALAERGVRIPDDLGLVAAGSCFTNLPVTVTNNPCDVHADEVLKMARALLDGDEAAPRQVLCTPYLVEKNSVKKLGDSSCTPVEAADALSVV